jgi:hypothetical protein
MVFLEALENRILHELRKLLYEICTHRRIVVQWVPSHCGITGNSKADFHAKEGNLMQQPVGAITYQQKKDMVVSRRRSPTFLQYEYHVLDRAAQVIIFRLKTGHNSLKAHMFSNFKIGDSAQCTCGQGSLTAERILQDCRHYNTLRSLHWPVVTNLEKKNFTALYKNCKQQYNTSMNQICRYRPSAIASEIGRVTS